MKTLFAKLIFFVIIFGLFAVAVGALFFSPAAPHQLIINPNDYNDAHLSSIGIRLMHRVQMQPINLLFFLIFIFATIHTFIAHRFPALANKYEVGIRPYASGSHLDENTSTHRGFYAELFDFLGEVEVVFGIWCIPLFAAITFFYGWEAVLDYINRENYKESLFIVVVMAIASTVPCIRFAEYLFGKISNLGGGTPLAWWVSVLTVGPFLGSLIKESVVMTVSAVILGKHFFSYRPPIRLAYATLALLFVNISMAGTLTNFGSTSVSMVAKPWGWDSRFMLMTFGWKALLGILIGNSLYFFYFRSDFKNMLAFKNLQNEPEAKTQVPLWISVVHVAFLAWLILNSENSLIALGSFVLFLGFYQATAAHQSYLSLRTPIMVGFFIASLIVHGGLQAWWIEPIVESLNESSAMLTTMFISAFANNTTINYLMTHIPKISDSMKVALFTGTLLGGGLTIMANGPNIVGYSLLSKYFSGQLKFGTLFVMALIPTLILFVVFWFESLVL